MTPSPRILTQTVICCPQPGCYHFFYETEEVFEHVSTEHLLSEYTNGDGDIEMDLLPVTIYNHDESTNHLCDECKLLFPTIQLAEEHLLSSIVHQDDTIDFAGLGLHQLLPRVSFERHQGEDTTGTRRVIFQQFNLIYGDNHIVVRSPSYSTSFVNNLTLCLEPCQ